MSSHVAANGKAFTDEDIERWATEAEASSGYTGGHLGPAVPGHPISVGAQARPFTLRLDSVRRAKLDEVAQERHMTASQLVRDLIDAL